jgi:hypothetical protein
MRVWEAGGQARMAGAPQAQSTAVVWPTNLMRVRMWSQGASHPKTVVDYRARAALKPVCFLSEGMQAIRLPGVGRAIGSSSPSKPWRIPR